MPETTIFPIKGDFDALAVRRMRDELEQLAEQDSQQVELDLSGLEFIDSAGVGAVVLLYKRLLANGRDLRVRGLSGQPKQLFAKLRMDQTLPIDDNQNQDN
ncbi:MAG: STAS domain-containing protein [Gammaproteobacteria bacterium]